MSNLELLENQIASEAPDPPKSALDSVHDFLDRFIAYPDKHSHIAHTLWVAHAHLMDQWESTPRIAFLSPEPGSGKTRALEATEPLVPNPVEAVNVTPAYLFRKVGEDGAPPTVLFDEIDTVFGPRAKENEEIRGLLNAGHRRGAVAGRCIMKGNKVLTEEIPAYCAVALAGIGGLPDTILSRSVVVRMRRRAPHETVTPWRRRKHVPQGEYIRDKLAKWAGSIEIDEWPDIPDGVEDRDADIWEALLAVADAAGGEWPQTARVAAVTLVTESKESTPSLGIRLLKDLYAIFGDDDVMSTQDILKKLNALEEAPWGNLKGHPIDARGLANRLRPYEVSSATVRVGEKTLKGYKAEDLYDTWVRYVPKAGERLSEKRNIRNKGNKTSNNGQDVTGVTDVTDLRETNPEQQQDFNEKFDKAFNKKNAPF